MNPAKYIPAIMVSTMTLISGLSVGHAAPPRQSLLKDFSKAELPKPTVARGSLWDKMPGLSSYLDRTTTTVTAPEVEAGRYPWRTEIVTTTFWVGEGTSKRNPVHNKASSWDTAWAKNYGGFDDPNPKNRANYIPVKFTPQQNPFYIALPYNDVTRGKTKPEASKVIPWFKESFERPGKTVLKGRWIAIRYKGKVAYAQWEDTGPFRTDHWEYVFGNERPKPNLNKGAGLDVSPAVRDYLGMKDTDVTDWRFVEFSEVPHGPWARHGSNNTFVQNARKELKRTVLATDVH